MEYTGELSYTEWHFKKDNKAIDLYNDDCLKRMDLLIKENIKVDAIICDPPYGTSNCRWDTVIPFGDMWPRLNALIKDKSVIALFGSEPFSSALRMSNIKNYKYDWVWDKKSSGGFLNAKKRPLKRYETISVFSNGVPRYFPIMEVRGKPRNKGSYNKRKGDGDFVYGYFENINSFNNTYYPTNIIEISNASQKGKVHPTQKPVELMKYLIKTYTLEGELVLDFTCGSGSTGVACAELNRNFIGVELDKESFNISKNRIKEVLTPLIL